MKNYIPILIVLLIIMVFVSGCITQLTKSSCGNKIIDAGEECDNSACPANKVCTEKCRCETFSPPALPG